jgi:hypothetical protein
VKWVARLINKPILTHDDFTEHSKIHPVNIEKRFERWHIAFEMAGDITGKLWKPTGNIQTSSSGKEWLNEQILFLRELLA